MVKMAIFGLKMAHKLVPWPSQVPRVGQNMLYGILYQTTMLWCCHSCNTIKITSVNGQYMVKNGHFWPKMAHKWAQWPPWMTTLGQYMLYGILYNTTMLWLCHFRPTACVLFSKCSQMAKFGPKCSKWPKMGHKWPIIGQNMAHLYFLTCLSHIWPESSAKSCIMYVFSWPPCALPKLTTVQLPCV